MNPANKWLIGNISAALIASTSLVEGIRYYAYYDIAGVPTVCMGYTGKGIVFGRKYSEEECNNFLRTELIKHSNGVLNCITQPLAQNVFNAFVLFAYNVGVAAACGSVAFKEYNAGNILAACDRLAFSPSGKPVWSYINGGKELSNGLVKRRHYERAICLGDPNARLG